MCEQFLCMYVLAAVMKYTHINVENDRNVHNDDENLTKNFAVFFVLMCYDVL
jgi:hypothetical protein